MGARNRLLLFRVFFLRGESIMTILARSIFKSAGVFLVLILLRGSIPAAPHWGDVWDLKQPDGSYEKVKVRGDEY